MQYIDWLVGFGLLSGVDEEGGGVMIGHMEGWMDGWMDV